MSRAQTKLEKLLEDRDALAKLIQETQKKVAREELARDKRRKYILGAELIKRAQTNERIRDYIRGMVNELTRKADQAAFKDWDVHPAPAASENEPA